MISTVGATTVVFAVIKRLLPSGVSNWICQTENK